MRGVTAALGLALGVGGEQGEARETPSGCTNRSC